MALTRIAIDGPGGAGKSTVAKALAGLLDIDYIDTGAMYRALGYKLLSTGTDMTDEDALAALLEDTDIDFSGGSVFLDGEDVSGMIRTPEVSKAASDCSAIGAVREKLVDLQRNMAAHKSVVMDGRDIGTNVIRDAEYKFFVTASPEERARRRFAEMQEKGTDETFESVLADMIKRDYNDSHRALNPLKKADDAVEIDTTDMSVEQVIGFITDMMSRTGKE